MVVSGLFWFSECVQISAGPFSVALVQPEVKLILVRLFSSLSGLGLGLVTLSMG